MDLRSPFPCDLSKYCLKVPSWVTSGAQVMVEKHALLFPKFDLAAMSQQAENFGKLAYFMSAESVRWRKPVHPGDTLVISVELTKARGKIGKARGVCTVDGETVSEAEVTFMLFDRQ